MLSRILCFKHHSLENILHTAVAPDMLILLMFRSLWTFLQGVETQVHWKVSLPCLDAWISSLSNIVHALKKFLRKCSRDTLHQNIKRISLQLTLWCMTLNKKCAENPISILMMDYHMAGFHTNSKKRRVLYFFPIMGSTREICLRHERPVRNRTDPKTEKHLH